MNDATIIRIATETTRHLGNAISVSPAPHMTPSYNALLLAARANHPGDPFLSALSPLPSPGESGACGESVCVAEITALFAQLAIALESLSG